jgi:hypothetical protein
VVKMEKEVFNFNALRADIQGVAVKNVRETPFYQAIVRGKVRDYVDEVLYEKSLRGLDVSLVDAFFDREEMTGGYFAQSIDGILEDYDDIEKFLECLTALTGVTCVIDAGAIDKISFGYNKKGVYCDLYAELAIEDAGDVSFGVLAGMIKHWMLAVVSRIYVESAQLNAKLVSSKDVVDYILHVGVKFDQNGNIVL